MTKRIIKRRKEGGISKTEAENMQLEFFNVKQSLKTLKKREAELRDRLFDYMDKALTPDTKGHTLFTTLDKDGNRIHLQRQARKSVKLNQERAIASIVEMGMDELIVSKQVVAKEVTQDQVIEVLLAHAPHLLDEMNEVDETALEQAVLNEKITMEQFEGLCDINITYAMTYVDDKVLEKEQ